MKANLNSILLFIAISVMGWNGYTTLQNALAIAALTVSVKHHEGDRVEMKAGMSDLNRKMDAVLLELAKKPPTKF